MYKKLFIYFIEYNKNLNTIIIITIIYFWYDLKSGFGSNFLFESFIFILAFFLLKDNKIVFI